MSGCPVAELAKSFGPRSGTLLVAELAKSFAPLSVLLCVLVVELVPAASAVPLSFRTIVLLVGSCLEVRSLVESD